MAKTTTSNAVLIPLRNKAIKDGKTNLVLKLNKLIAANKKAGDTSEKLVTRTQAEKNIQIAQGVKKAPKGFKKKVSVAELAQKKKEAKEAQKRALKKKGRLSFEYKSATRLLGELSKTDTGLKSMGLKP